MKPNTLTTVDKLSPGDQFIKEGDKNNIIYTVLEFQPRKKGVRRVKKGDLMLPDYTTIKEQIIYIGKNKL